MGAGEGLVGWERDYLRLLGVERSFWLDTLRTAGGLFFVGRQPFCLDGWEFVVGYFVFCILVMPGETHEGL